MLAFPAVNMDISSPSSDVIELLGRSPHVVLGASIRWFLASIISG
jgi:hypothetical protein